MFNQTEAPYLLHFYLFSGDNPLRPAGSLSYSERSRLELAQHLIFEREANINIARAHR